MMKKRALKPSELEELRVLVDYQLGLGAGKALIPSLDRVLVTVSPNTLRIRNVYVDGRLAFSIRAGDSKIILHIYGGYLLWRNYNKYPKVIIVNEVSDFIADGGNVFAKHVLHVDDYLRAGDEVIVINEQSNLLAVGTLKLSPTEILSFTYGEAVRVREGIKKLNIPNSNYDD